VKRAAVAANVEGGTADQRTQLCQVELGALYHRFSFVSQEPRSCLCRNARRCIRVRRAGGEDDATVSIFLHQPADELDK
jgi:hypothetical protein